MRVWLELRYYTFWPILSAAVCSAAIREFAVCRAVRTSMDFAVDTEYANEITRNIRIAVATSWHESSHPYE